MQLALQHTTPLPGATSTADVPASITDRVCDVCLTKLSISNQHASYFNTHGITPEFKRRISEKLKNDMFSLNADEATNKNMEKVLNVLVRFFGEDENAVKTHQEHEYSQCIYFST